MDTEKIIKTIPKVLLHDHLDGGLRAQTIIELADELDYKKLPEVLKTLAITLRDPDDPQKIFHFLLRVNSDKTSYEASIAPLERDGLFGMGVTVLDHKNRGLKKLSGILKSILPPGFVIPSPKNFWPFLFLPFLIFLVLILILKLKRKKNRDLSFAS